MPKTPVKNQIVVTHVHAPEPIEIHRGTCVTHPHPKHWHEEFHVCAITGGGGYIEAKGTSHFTGVGTLIVVAPGEVHSNHAEGDGCSYVNIYVPAELMRRDAQFPLLTGDQALAANFVTMVNRIEHGTKLERESQIQEFFDDFSARHAGQSSNRPMRESKAVQRVRDYLEANFDREVALQELSLLTDLSGCYLNRAFRRHYGIPPHAYQIQARISRAKRMLRNNSPISHVAYQTGFSDQAHFTRHFKRMVGVTPGQFIEDKNVQYSEMAAD